MKAQRRSFADTTIELVRSRLPHPEKARFVQGYFPESLDFMEAADSDVTQEPVNAVVSCSSSHTEQREERSEPCFALVSLDPDLYEPTREGLRYFYPRLAPGGRILIHDYTSCQFEGVKMAVDEYCCAHELFVVPLMDLHGTAVLMKV